LKKTVLSLSLVAMVISSILIISNKEEPKAISKLDTKVLNEFRADHIASIVNRNEEIKSNIIVLEGDFVIVGVTLKQQITPEKENQLLGRIKKNIYFTDGQINKVYVTSNIQHINKIKDLLKTIEVKKDSSNIIDELNLLIKELRPIY